MSKALKNKQNLNDIISVRDFGAKCDGSTDDTVAIQDAITFALTAPGGIIPVILVPGFCKITPNTININRPSGQIDELRIVGVGKLSGFYSNTSGNYFTSSIAHTTTPVSEWVSFENINFHNSDWNNLANAVNGDKFLRIKFTNCYFLRVRAAQTTNYLQTYYFHMCQARQWKGWFASAKRMYDVHVNMCMFEQANAQQGRGFQNYDAALAVGASGSAGCSFTNNLFQGCHGPFVESQSATGLTVSGNYFEYNDNSNLNLSQGATSGVSVTGNAFFLTPANAGSGAFWDIQIGECNGFHGAGNFCDGRLYDFQNAQATATVGMGDRTISSLFRGTPSNVLSGGSSATWMKFPSSQVSSSDANTLDDYQEGTWTPTLANGVNCTSLAVTAATYTKVGRQVSLQMQGTFNITASATLTSFTFTLPEAQGNNADPACGSAVINFTGCGFVADNSGGDGTVCYVAFPANQVSGTGAQSWRASITYNAAT